MVYAMAMEGHAKLLKVTLTIPEEQVSLFISNTQESSSCLVTLSTGNFKKLYSLKLHSFSKNFRSALR